MFWDMAAGADCSPPFVLDGGYIKDNVPAARDEQLDVSDEYKHASNGKPPRHLSVVRHSVSSATLVQPNCVVSKLILC